MKTLVIFLVLVGTATAQEPTLAAPMGDPVDDLAAKVADIAALSVRNTDDIAELRTVVSKVTTRQTEFMGRLKALEDKVFGLQPAPAPPVIVEPIPVLTTYAPARVYTPPAYSYQTVPARTKTVTRTGGRTIEPIRRVFRCLIIRRLVNRLRGSVVKTMSSGYVYPPAGVSVWDHLAGPPHYISDPWKLSYNQAMELHTRLH